ncbi:unnamed protein product [Bursaphelenchus xylophilus]|uniref:(pine wood nematode) hypothetical protein n=1 Tax=Bursaphelenchus xylophilus TaxID=6326 RepID=A0A1I7S1W9_BURXY|nr:unnamed protein product [Bursaphelenchus xylophilus]CAG9090051.1 unnamed protein product [Bursaphelenchus xylophilus]
MIRKLVLWSWILLYLVVESRPTGNEIDASFGSRIETESTQDKDENGLHLGNAKCNAHECTYNCRKEHNDDRMFSCNRDCKCVFQFYHD